MLSKEYLVTGVFPKLNKSDQQLHIRYEDGTPTRCTQVRRIFNEGTIRARHKLANPITFYAVTEFEGCRLISISDGARTRYYWLTPTRHHTYMLDKPSKGFEEAWKNLFEGIVMDERLSATLFYRVIWPFFEEMLDFKRTKKCFFAHLTGQWKGKSVDLILESYSTTPRGEIAVVSQGKEQIITLKKPILNSLFG
mgnify:FL=1